MRWYRWDSIAKTRLDSEVMHLSGSITSSMGALLNSLRIVTIYISLQFRYDSQSVSSDQVWPLCFLHLYILRAKLGRMKRIGIEISAACYDSLRFRYDFSISTISLRFRSVLSDQVPPLCFLRFYILRAKSGRIKRIGVEISAAYYDFVTIRYDFQFRYDFVTVC